MSKSTTGRKLLDDLEKRVAELEAQVRSDPARIAREINQQLEEHYKNLREKPELKQDA